MSDNNDVKMIFSKNLQRLMAYHGKNQTEMAKIVGVSNAAFNNWYLGLKMPRMNSVQDLAIYFGTDMSALIEKQDVQQDQYYYMDKETRKIAQEIFDNPKMRILFDASRDASPEDLKMVSDLLLHMKQKENHEE